MDIVWCVWVLSSCSESMWWFDWRTFSRCHSPTIKLILKRVWPSLNRYKMFFIQTSTPPPPNHEPKTYTAHEKHFMQKQDIVWCVWAKSPSTVSVGVAEALSANCPAACQTHHEVEEKPLRKTSSAFKCLRPPYYHNQNLKNIHINI